MKTETKPALLARRALSCLLAVVLAAGLAPLAPGEAKAEEQAQPREYMGFSDVYPGDWFATDDVLGYAVDRGLLQGYGDGSLFGPYDSVTRAQVATILWRVAGEPEADAEDFSDVDYAQWYGAAVEWARSTGVVSGYGDSNAFGPNDPVTREQLAVMLSNHAEKVAGLDASSDCTALDAIAGASQVATWARTQMGWAVDEGIVSGSVDAAGVAWVDPQGTAQRCQAAKMVSVFHRDVLGLDSVVDYAEGVVAAPAGTTVSEDGASATVPAAEQEIRKGEVVVVEPTEESPEGGAIVVESVDRRADGSAVVSGRQAELGEIVDELQVTGSSTRLVSFEAAEGVEIVDKATGVATERASFDDSTTLADKTFKIGKYGTLDLDASVDYALDFGWGEINLIELSIDATADFDWHYSARVGERDKKIGEALFWTTVPTVTIGVDFYVTYTASGEATIEAHASADAGVRYESGVWDTWADKDFGASAAFEGAAQLAAEPSVSIGFLGSGIVDASVEVGGMLEGGLYVRETGLICADLDAWLYVQMGVGQHDSLAHALGISKTFDLVDKSNGPRVKAHTENGVLVPECTWVDAEDPEKPEGPSDDVYYQKLEPNGYSDTPEFVAPKVGFAQLNLDMWNINQGTKATFGALGAPSGAKEDGFTLDCFVDPGTVYRITYYNSDGSVLKSDVAIDVGYFENNEQRYLGTPIELEVLCGRVVVRWLSGYTLVPYTTEAIDPIPYPLHISRDELTLRVGETATIDTWTDFYELVGEENVSIPMKDKGWRWTSADENIADVTPIYGKVTAMAPGTTTLRVLIGGYERTVTVTVYE